MGRLEVREAVKEYFAKANLQYVGTVHSARPEILQEQDYENSPIWGQIQLSENGSSAVLIVDIPSDTRQRRADTGRGAVNDTLICKVVIEVFLASLGGGAVAAQNDYDTVIDQMVDLIRADATLDAQGTIWSAGEYEAGIAHQQSEPFTDVDGLNVNIFGTVQFDAWQWISGPV
jgi:hypothetical protein